MTLKCSWCEVEQQLVVDMLSRDVNWSSWSHAHTRLLLPLPQVRNKEMAESAGDKRSPIKRNVPKRDPCSIITTVTCKLMHGYKNRVVNLS